MNKNNLLENTLNLINQDVADLEKKVAMARSFQDMLATGVPLRYEVHVQCCWPDQRSIMAEGTNLYETSQRARSLWKAHNSNAGGSFSGMEAFARIGDFRVAIMPKDAVRIASESEGCPAPLLASSFHLDNRVLKHEGPKVWDIKTELPSAWYTYEQTEEPDTEALAVA